MSIKFSGLIGKNISYSYSTKIHNYFIEKLNLNAHYFLIDVKEEKLTKKFVDSLLQSNFLGFNVTVPYKEKALSFADYFEEEINTIKSTNTLYLKNNKIIAVNTDYIGFEKSIGEIKNKNVLVLGSGGSSRSVLYSLIKNEAKSVKVYNRTLEKPLKIKEESFFKSIEVLEKVISENTKNLDVIINTTSLKDKNPIDFENLKNINEGCLFYDLTYSQKTVFLKEAEEKNYKIKNGLDMLIYQAIFSFEKIFNVSLKDIKLEDVYEVIEK